MKIAIIGAGFSACNLYDNLKHRYENIKIFEKSRGVGGRLSTKYIDDKFIDHGVSSFFPITEDLKEFSLDLVRQKVLRSRYDEFLPINGINKICKFLIDDKDLIRNCRIIQAKFLDNKWCLIDENENQYTGFDKLFLSIPATQILQMDIDLKEDIKTKLSNINYDSTFSLILYSKNRKLEDLSNYFENKNVENIIDNSKKYFYKDFNSYIIHSTKNFANNNNHLSKDEILINFLDTFKNSEKMILKEFTQIPHLWKYAFAKNSLDMPFYLNDERNLGICGDYFNYNNLEASFLSSQLLGNMEF